MGRLPAAELTELFKGARSLVWPSEGCYEPFAYGSAESFSCGAPVIASRTGVQAEVVSNGVTRLPIEAGMPEDLTMAVQWAWEHPAEMTQMGAQARPEYESKCTAERNYPLLIGAHESAIERAQQREHAARAS